MIKLHAGSRTLFVTVMFSTTRPSTCSIWQARPRWRPPSGRSNSPSTIPPTLSTFNDDRIQQIVGPTRRKKRTVTDAFIQSERPVCITGTGISRQQWLDDDFRPLVICKKADKKNDWSEWPSVRRKVRKIHPVIYSVLWITVPVRYWYKETAIAWHCDSLTSWDDIHIWVIYENHSEMSESNPRVWFFADKAVRCCCRIVAIVGTKWPMGEQGTPRRILTVSRGWNIFTKLVVTFYFVFDNKFGGRMDPLL